jgi:hypothetical protein
MPDMDVTSPNKSNPYWKPVKHRWHRRKCYRKAKAEAHIEVVKTGKKRPVSSPKGHAISLSSKLLIRDSNTGNVHPLCASYFIFTTVRVQAD